MFDDPRVTSAVSPEVLAFLESNQPAEGIDAEQQIGHWMGVTACVLAELANARQRIRELVADA
ncbi:hypothetical protein [Pseudarthrobacter siccitolerans]